MTKVLLGFAASALLTACGGLASTTSDSRERQRSDRRRKGSVQHSLPIAGIAVDSDHVYWTRDDGATSAVLRAPVVAGGPVVTLASGQDVALDIAVDATSVYWTNQGSCMPGATPCGSLMKLTPK
jgi:hypothetical protein